MKLTSEEINVLYQLAKRAADYNCSSSVSAQRYNALVAYVEMLIKLHSK